MKTFDYVKTPWIEQSWRWFGPSDPVTLRDIRQAGATGVVTALHHVPNGSIWSVAEINRRKSEIADAGLRWSAVESVPVHEEIKQNKGRTTEYLANYAQSLVNLAECGLDVVCYNFMPLLDWTRTQLAYALPDGAEALRFDTVDAAIFDLYILRRQGAAKDYPLAIQAVAEERFVTTTHASKEELQRIILLGLPGTVEDLTLEQFREALQQYNGIDSNRLRENHTIFLKSVVPIAEKCGVKLCIHPDDPPFSIFGLPRIASTESDLTAILAAMDSPSNGISFCSGSLGAHPQNNLPAMFRKVGSRVHFLHLRNVQREADGSFYEAPHLRGSTDMAELMVAIVEEMARRESVNQPVAFPMRPDHGHRMLSDLEKEYYAGYSLIGRLRGLAELRGLENGIRHLFAHRPDKLRQ